MRPDGMRLSARHRAWLYTTFTLLFLSGAVGWVLKKWFPVVTEFGPQPHPAQRGLILLHGAAAMLAMIIVGTLIPLHMKRGWRAQLNRSNGVMLITFILVLTFTGYTLYYAGGESLRATASFAHIAFGLTFPLALLLHILSGRRAHRR